MEHLHTQYSEHQDFQQLDIEHILPSYPEGFEDAQAMVTGSSNLVLGK